MSNILKPKNPIPNIIFTYNNMPLKKTCTNGLTRFMAPIAET